VVSAAGQMVGKASVSLSNLVIVTTGHNTMALEPVPGHTGLTSVASHGEALEESTAGDSVLSGEELGEFSLGGDAEAIVEGLGGRKGPARTTVRLIAGISDHGAFGPLGSGVELSRYGVSELSSSVLLDRETDYNGGVDEGTAHVLHLILGDSLKSGGLVGFPEVSLHVDVLNHELVDRRLIELGGGSSGYKGEEEGGLHGSMRERICFFISTEPITTR
jgi:hypothetical protein